MIPFTALWPGTFQGLCYVLLPPFPIHHPPHSLHVKAIMGDLGRTRSFLNLGHSLCHQATCCSSLSSNVVCLGKHRFFQKQSALARALLAPSTFLQNTCHNLQSCNCAVIGQSICRECKFPSSTFGPVLTTVCLALGPVPGQRRCSHIWAE